MKACSSGCAPRGVHGLMCMRWPRSICCCSARRGLSCWPCCCAWGRRHDGGAATPSVLLCLPLPPGPCSSLPLEARPPRLSSLHGGMCSSHRRCGDRAPAAWPCCWPCPARPTWAGAAAGGATAGGAAVAQAAGAATPAGAAAARGPGLAFQAEAEGAASWGRSRGLVTPGGMRLEGSSLGRNMRWLGRADARADVRSPPAPMHWLGRRTGRAAKRATPAAPAAAVPAPSADGATELPSAARRRLPPAAVAWLVVSLPGSWVGA